MPGRPEVFVDPPVDSDAAVGDAPEQRIVDPCSEMDETFQTMERKLYRIIMNPAMIVAWILGLTLIWIRSRGYGHGVWGPIGLFVTRPWMITKLSGVLFLTWWHHQFDPNREPLNR